MTYNQEIENLRQELNNVRSNKDFNTISNKILRLAKKYNSLDYRDEYLIIGNEVYGLRLKR